MPKVFQNHFNPRAYLQGFSGTKGYLCRYEKENGKIIESTYTSFGSQRHLYTDYFETKISAPIDDGFLRIQEKLIKCFVEGAQLDFDEKDFRNLANFVALQAFRTPASWDIFVQSWNEYPPKGGVPTVEVLKEKFSEHMLTFANKMYPRLERSKLTLYVAPPEIPFITSDNVATMYRYIDKVFTGYTDAYSDKDTQILFPVNSRLCLWSGEYIDSEVGEVELKSSKMAEVDVQKANEMILGNCVQYAYSGSRTILDKAIQDGKDLPKCSLSK